MTEMRCGPTKEIRRPVIMVRRDEASDACVLSCHSRVFHIMTISLSLSYLLQASLSYPTDKGTDCLILEA